MRIVEEISASIQRASALDTHLQNIRSTLIPHHDIAWYPHSTLGSFCLGLQSLRADRKVLLTPTCGHRALDIGFGDGDVSFFLESMGYTVTGCDWPETNYNRTRGAALLKKELNSNVNFLTVNVDTAAPQDIPEADLCVCLGILYHLRNPLQLLDNLARRVTYCLLSTRVLRYTPDQVIDCSHYPIAYLVGPEELNNDDTNFWIFTEPALRRMFERSGWLLRDMQFFGDDRADPVAPHHDGRVYCLLESWYRRSFTRAELMDGWHQLEDNWWRWTARRFSFTFPAMKILDETLLIAFQFPEACLQRLGPITLTMKAAGVPIGTRIYTEPGPYEERFALSPGESVLFEGEFDKALGPDDLDLRELGAIVYDIHLEDSQRQVIDPPFVARSVQT